MYKIFHYRKEQNRHTRKSGPFDITRIFEPQRQLDQKSRESNATLKAQLP
jgi:hypothetical protein